ncbi:MAG: hypothetical protein PHT41_01940 [Candidatus Omnitrophica bacterium]|nr:hypothetical protein [Candidatus Omnitrophota bacterium]MDD5238301.1 hypothetical protein [Candidatus Omnitrophota bacterium]
MKASILAYFFFFISTALAQEVNNQNLPTSRGKDIDIEYNGAGLTEIKIKDNNLDYIWYTLKDETRPSPQSLEAYNRYEKHIKLTPEQLSQFSKWIEEHKIIEMKNTIVKRETNTYASAFVYHLKVAYNEKQQNFTWDSDDEVSPEFLKAKDTLLKICEYIRGAQKDIQQDIVKTDEQKLEFTIKSDKWSYLLGEPITLEIVLKNKTQQPFMLCDFYSDIDSIGERGNFRFQVFRNDVRNESGLTQKYIHTELLEKMSVPFEKTHQVKPGEEVIFRVTLDKWYDLYVGDYSIICTYSSPCSQTVLSWVPFLLGDFTSNTIKIRVFEFESPQK